VLLVLDASLGQNALKQAEQFQAAVGVTGLAITKLDGTAKGGVVIAIARRFGLPIRFVGVGEQAEDFGVFEAGAFVDGLLRPGQRRDRLRARLQALPQRAGGARRGQLRARTRARWPSSPATPAPARARCSS
jgi:hypothetical protein